MPAIKGVSGLASGIDTAAIVDALVAADRASTKVIEDRKNAFQARFDAVKSLNTKLLSSQIDLAALKQSSTFQVRKATSGNDAALGASATSAAVPGTYQFEVVSVAKAHQRASAGQASATASLVTTAGALDIQVGNGVQTTLTISAANGSLAGIAKAINDAKLGVTASVVNDGTATPNRLVLLSDQTGTASALTINGSGDLAGLFGAGAQTLAVASDAVINIGSSGGGATPLTITRSSNTMADVLPGVTLTVKAPAASVTVTVGTDATPAKDAINAFVKSLNDTIGYLRQSTGFDATTGKFGVLASEKDLGRSLDAVIQAFSDVVPGLPQAMNNLSALGIAIDRAKGTFTVDDAMLSGKLAADPQAVAKLFINSGTSSDTGISFAALSNRTVVTSPFAVAITQAASQARAATTADLDATTTIAPGGQQFDLTLNGRAFSLTLTAGNYTRAALADHLQQVIDTAAGKNQIVVSLDGDRLDVRSRAHGSFQNLSISAGIGSMAADKLKLVDGSSAGTDVAGTIDGTAVVGNGQVMSGVIGGASEGLRLVVTATAPVASATITASKGLAQLAGDRLQGMTDGSTGSVPQKQDGLQSTIADLTEQVKKTDARLAIRRTRYLKQFAAMERLISKFQSQGQALTNQLGLANANNDKGQ